MHCIKNDKLKKAYMWSLPSVFIHGLNICWVCEIVWDTIYTV